MKYFYSSEKIYNSFKRQPYRFILNKPLLRYLFLFFLLFSLVNAKAQTPILKDYSPPPNINKLWHINELFKYSVRYGCFNIGTVTVQLMPDTMYRGQKCHCIKAVIKSNPRIPFIGNREKVYYSLMSRNDSVPYTLLYWTDNISGHSPNDEIYRLDYSKKKVYTFKKNNPTDTLSLTLPSICGPVSLFYTRLFAGTNKVETIPIYINQKKDKIVMDNHTEIQDIKCKSFQSGHVAAYVSNGQANFDGPFGFNGKFTVWYTTDSLRIPVAANLKVWFGNVKVRAIKYKKLN